MSTGFIDSSTLACRTAVIVVAVLCAACVPMAGCTRPEPAKGKAGHHGHDGAGQHTEEEAAHDEEEAPPTEADIDMPRDYTSAVARLQAYRAQILSAIAAGHPHEAHRPLDEMDIVVTKLMLLARDSRVPRREWEEVNLARRELRAQFDLAHAKLDQEQPVDRAALEQATAAPLKRLEAVAARLPKTGDASSAGKPAPALQQETQP